MSWLARGGAVLVFVFAPMLVSSCGGREPVYTVVLDTDAALPANADADPSISPVARFDRLRVEFLPPNGIPNRYFEYSRDFDLTKTTSWPLSFAVRTGNAGQTFMRMRVRLWSSSALRVQDEGRFAPDLAPGKIVFLERLVFASLPEEDETITIRLAGSCSGVPSDFAKALTCIDSSELRNASEGIERGDVAPLQTGSWSLARGLRCSSDVPKDAICIPGGLTIRGDDLLERADRSADHFQSAPRHLVHLKPFFIDRNEVTVARLRAFAATGALTEAQLPNSRGGTNLLCTWTPQPTGHEDEPVNCVPFRTARTFCRSLGGDLPTDAQWEHAARGFKVSEDFVWGYASARCCAGRFASSNGCGGGGPAVVSSFADPAKCEGIADVSSTGVVDLAGNVREMVLDATEDYDSEKCPLNGVAVDPVCDPDDDSHIARGGSFRASFEQVRIGLRTKAALVDDVGFRCAYPGAR